MCSIDSYSIDSYSMDSYIESRWGSSSPAFLFTTHSRGSLSSLTPLNTGCRIDRGVVYLIQ